MSREEKIIVADFLDKLLKAMIKHDKILLEDKKWVG